MNKNNDKLVPDLRTGLDDLVMAIMAENDLTVTEDVQDAEVIEQPENTNNASSNFFSHRVESVPVYVIDGNGNYVKIQNFHGVNRTPKDGTGTEPEILHIAPNTSSVISMDEIEDIAKQLIDAGYEYCNHGELKNNKWLFIELEHPDLPKMHFNGTSLVPKMFLGSSHDGTLAMKSTVKIVDTVCYNTFMMNHNSDLLFKAKHTRNASYRIQEYRQGLEDASELLNQYYDQVDKLSNTPFSGKHKLEGYFAGSIGAKKMERNRKQNGKTIKTLPMYSGKHQKQIEQLFESYEQGAGQKERGETLWSAFSAVTDWCDNHPANEKSVKLGTNLIGNRARQKQVAWNLANECYKTFGNSTTTFIQ